MEESTTHSPAAAEKPPLTERFSLTLARWTGGVMRGIVLAARPGSAAEAGYRMAGLDVDALRGIEWTPASPRD